DVALTDADFQNPWKATQFLAIWMKQLLIESAGNLDLAVRAYPRGSRDARDPLGDAYLRLVQQRRAMFIYNRQAPPSWSQVWRIGRDIERENWTWLTPRRSAAPPADDDR